MVKIRSKQSWQAGDLFTIELSNGTRAVGKIVGQEREALNGVLCAFYSSALQGGELARESDTSCEQLISIQFVSPVALDQGHWKVACPGALFLVGSYIDLAALRATGFVGVRVLTDGVIESFLNAYHALGLWDAYADPTYFDKLLITAGKKPAQLVFKKH